VAIEADRVDQPLDLLRAEPGHRARRARHAEEARRRGCGHRIARLRRQHGRDEHLERVFLALLRDLLDGGQIEIVDRTCERAHHGVD